MTDHKAVSRKRKPGFLYQEVPVTKGAQRPRIRTWVLVAGLIKVSPTEGDERRASALKPRGHPGISSKLGMGMRSSRPEEGTNLSQPAIADDDRSEGDGLDQSENLSDGDRPRLESSLKFRGREDR